ncbi:hypothetical protein [Micromonospora sp. CPCC 206061]
MTVTCALPPAGTVTLSALTVNIPAAAVTPSGPVTVRANAKVTSASPVLR